MGHQELGAVRMAEAARARGWSDAQANNAQRLIDGGIGGGLGLLPVRGTRRAEVEGAHLILASGPGSLDAWVDPGEKQPAPVGFR